MVLGIPKRNCCMRAQRRAHLGTHVKVSAYDSGRIFLEGYLEERIVPDESAWDAGDDGVVTLFMQKTNLALFASPEIPFLLVSGSVYSVTTDTR